MSINGYCHSWRILNLCGISNRSSTRQSENQLAQRENEPLLERIPAGAFENNFVK